ncbi:hypothetical protein [Moorena producens]|uniref:hypothetical protein n=1 Tax=Moorena producens TaxID=1155739 RepID=UPI0009F425E7|nr:hypothetical protein [Moorena producens]
MSKKARGKRQEARGKRGKARGKRGKARGKRQEAKSCVGCVRGGLGLIFRLKVRVGTARPVTHHPKARTHFPPQGQGWNSPPRNAPPGLPTPDSRFPIPDSRFPTPDSRLPIPDSLLPTPYSLAS